MLLGRRGRREFIVAGMVKDMTVVGDWEARRAELWSLLDELEPAALRTRVDAPAGEL
jgi:hypothetical protein